MLSPASLARPRLDYCFLVVLASVALVAFVGGIANLFVAEDFSIVYLHSRQDFSQLVEFMLKSARFRPIYYGFSWVQVQLFGLQPLGYHIVSLLLHIGVSLGIYRIGRLFAHDNRVGLVAGLLYVVYPRSHQAVLWMAAHQLVLVTLFSLICCYSHKKFLDTRLCRWRVGTFLSFFCALMSHETGIMLVVLLPALEFVFAGDLRSGVNNLLRPGFYWKYLAFTPLIALYLVTNFGGARMFKLMAETPQVQELITQGLINVETYHFTGLGMEQLKNLFGSFTYLVLPQIPLRSLDANLLTAIIALMVALYLAVLFVKGSPVVRFGVIWVITTTVPFALFVPFGNAERYFYLPAVGLCLAGAAAVLQAHARLSAWRYSFAQGSAAVVLLAYTVTSFLLIQCRIDDWRWAGSIAERIVDQAVRLNPSPHPGETILFVGLPATYGQAYLFSIGVRGALLLRYQQADVQVYQTNDPAVSDFLSRAPVVRAPLPNACVFLYRNGVLIDKSKMVSNWAQLHQDGWY